MYKIIKVFGILAFMLGGCSVAKDPVPVNPEIIQLPVSENQVPGTVNQPWVERQFNQVQVPGQLDAEEVYYRPSHEAIYEIRPGRSQVVEYPADDVGTDLRYKTRQGR